MLVTRTIISTDIFRTDLGSISFSDNARKQSIDGLEFHKGPSSIKNRCLIAILESLKPASDNWSFVNLEQRLTKYISFQVPGSSSIESRSSSRGIQSKAQSPIVMLPNTPPSSKTRSQTLVRCGTKKSEKSVLLLLACVCCFM